MPFEHENVTYRVAVWVAHPEQRKFRVYRDATPGLPNWNPVAFVSSPVPPERCEIDLNAVAVCAINLSLRRAWGISAGDRLKDLARQFIADGVKILSGNPSPRPNVHALGRAFCSVEGQILAPEDVRIPLYGLVARDHDQDEIRLVNDGRALLLSAEI